MELNKSILLAFFILSFSIEAYHQDALSPSPSPSYQPSLNNPCKPFLRFDFSFYHSPAIVNPILGNLCAATQNPIMCCTFLTPCLATGNTVDSISVLSTLILQLSAQVDYAISFADGLCENKSLSSFMTESLEKSIELYAQVIDELQDGIVVLKAADFTAVKTIFNSCIIKFGLCDEVFLQQGATKNWPFKGLNELLVDLAGFGVDISAKLSMRINN